MTSLISDLNSSWSALIVNSSETVSSHIINGVSPNLVRSCFPGKLSNHIFLSFISNTGVSSRRLYKTFFFVQLLLFFFPFPFNIIFLYLMANPIYYGASERGGAWRTSCCTVTFAHTHTTVSVQRFNGFLQQCNITNVIPETLGPPALLCYLITRGVPARLQCLA